MACLMDSFVSLLFYQGHGFFKAQLTIVPHGRNMVIARRGHAGEENKYVCNILQKATTWEHNYFFSFFDSVHIGLLSNRYDGTSVTSFFLFFHYSVFYLSSFLEIKFAVPINT